MVTRTQINTGTGIPCLLVKDWFVQQPWYAIMSKGAILFRLTGIFGQFPLFLSRLLGRWLGWLLLVVPNRSRSVTRTNIAACFPELSPDEQDSLVRRSLQHTGMLTLEMAAIWCRCDRWLEQHIVRVNHRHLLDDALAGKQGVILLLPHIGNWEVFSRYIPLQGKMMALYEPPKLKEMDRVIKTCREKTGAQLVPTNNKGVAQLLKHLKQGGITCILPDQVPPRRCRGSVIAPFFGHPAQTMTLASQLATRTRCRVIGGTAKRVSEGFVIDFYDIDKNIYDTDAAISARAINQFVESCIAKMPEQYQWEYKRFKRSDPEHDFYKATHSAPEIKPVASSVAPKSRGQ